MAHKTKATLSDQNKDVVFIKPSRLTAPTNILSLSTIDNDPMTNFSVQTLHVYPSPNSSSSHTTKLDPANVIKEALSEALFYYYPLAGKLERHADGKLRINCNSKGVPFIEAICNCDLSSLNYLDGDDVEVAKHFEVDFPSIDESENQYPFVFKVIKFLCGGFALVVSCSHSVCDGTGASQVLRAVAELASGKTEPSVKPVWEREILVGTITSQPMKNPLEKASAAVSPYIPTTDYSHECSRVDGESITRLKMSLTKESDNFENSEKKGFTTFETLAAYIWRSRARALKLSYDGVTLLRIAVGLRARLLDPLPCGYYGNSIGEAFVTLTVRELNERPLWEVVKLISERIKAATKYDYIKHLIDTMETKSMKFDYESGAITSMTDWRHLGLLETVDFGWKEAVNTVPVPDDLYGYWGLCNILPPSILDSSMKGGARVFVSLPRDAMPKFKEEMKALQSTQNDA